MVVQIKVVRNYLNTDSITKNILISIKTVLDDRFSELVCTHPEERETEQDTPVTDPVATVYDKESVAS